jgi:hypothetical protein
MGNAPVNIHRITAAATAVVGAVLTSMEPSAHAVYQ